MAAALPMRAGAQTDDAAFAALERYCGVYRTNDRADIGVNRFLNDAGQGVLLFADYATSVVRPLRAIGGGAFTMGPTFDAPAPPALTVRFEESARGVERLVLTGQGGASVVATKAATREEPVSFSQGDAVLSGELILPPGPGPHPAVVLLHGSGPLTRHSFGPYPRFFNSLGLAVLIFDKRGAGASTGRRLDASTGAPTTLWPEFYPKDLLGDAQAALRLLRGRPEIDTRRIGAWGSSEGGMLATQLAARDKSVAFAINASGFMGPLWKTILYQGGAMMKAAGKPQAEIDAATEFNRSWMRTARTGRGWDAFKARREEIQASGKTGWMFYMNGAFTSLDQMRWAWRHILSYDSLPALRDVDCPVLGLFGAADVLTDAPTASQAMRQAVLAGGNRDVTVKVIPGASHSLMETPGRRGMAPGVFDTLRDWLGGRGFTERRG